MPPPHCGPRPRRPADLLPLFADLPAVAEPGAEQTYCDANYVLVGLVIEAATEKEEVKRQIVSNICPSLKPEVIVGTNTSSISITRLASRLVTCFKAFTSKMDFSFSKAASPSIPQEHPMTPIPVPIRTHALVKRYGDHVALRALDLEVEPGEAPLGEQEAAPDQPADRRADPGVAAVGQAGDEQQGVARLAGGVGRGAGFVGLEGEGHHHPGQHDVVRQRQDGQGHGLQVGHVALLQEGGEVLEQCNKH